MIVQDMQKVGDKNMDETRQIEAVKYTYAQNTSIKKIIIIIIIIIIICLILNHCHWI